MINHVFSVTNSAIAAAKEKLLLRGTPNAAIRLGIKSGGCQGYNYVVLYEDAPPAQNDFVIDTENVKFLIDKKSLTFLKGSTLDYVKAFIYEGFKFINPQEVGVCSCEKSFSIKK